MLLGRIDLLLGTQLLEGADDAEARVAWLDDIIHEAVGGSVVGVGEGLAVFLFLLCSSLGGVLRGGYFLGEDDLYGTCRAHHSDLSRGPSEVDIRAEVLGAHDDVGTTIGLT